MKNLTIPALFLAAQLGCYAQLDNSSITMTHSLCSGGSNCIPGGPGVPLSVIQIGGQNTFNVPFGDQPLLQHANSLGPVSVNSSLLLNDAAFVMKTAGASFSGVDSITLLAALQPPATPGADPCATASNCVAIASYDKTRDGAADQQLVLKGNGADLLNYINATTHDLIVQIQASGFAPNTSWNADVAMDMALTARANFP